MKLGEALRSICATLLKKGNERSNMEIGIDTTKAGLDETNYR